MYVGCTSDREFLAVAAENGYWLRRLRDPAKPGTNTNRAATSASSGSATRRGARTTAACSRTRGSSPAMGSTRASESRFEDHEKNSEGMG